MSEAEKLGVGDGLFCVGRMGGEVERKVGVSAFEEVGGGKRVEGVVNDKGGI